MDQEMLAQLRGKTLVAGSDEVGEIDEVYAHSGEDRPALAAVSTEGRTVLVPLPDADIGENGTVTVPFDAEAVSGAPEPGGDTLAEDEFEAVYEHYGIADATMRDQSHP